ncbi:TPA: hypothetical protein N0F65_008743 [Lagenidium giganteum]|uniref:PH domain-containing protein n=1 Tax=Lagenidium giganteum TaxID=4803 RepID=A0AAV2Z381_9STRA|nr:TPA: hypothetical protein N0F65_008743 [Lagenidium giganteum]
MLPVVLLVLIALMALAQRLQEWLFLGCWVLYRAVFPSQNVTWLKVVCVFSGIALSALQFLHKRIEDGDDADDGNADPNKGVLPGWSLPAKSPSVHPLPLNNKVPTKCDQPREVNLDLLHQTDAMLRATDDITSSQSPAPEVPQLWLVDDVSQRRCAVNEKEPIAFETEWFKGTFLLMVRDTRATKEQQQASTWAHLFGNKRRSLWVQVQGTLKAPLAVPKAKVFVAAELPTTTRVSFPFWTQKIVNLLIAVTKKFAPHVHISFGPETDATTSTASDAGNVELAHAAFPLFQSVDELVVTPPGSVPPALGKDVLGESPSDRTKRMSTPQTTELAIGSVYTFQFYTMYADLAQWRIVNVPGLPEMPLTKIIGDNGLRLAAYGLAEPTAQSSATTVHRNAFKRYLFSFSIHHRNSASSIGVTRPATVATSTSLPSPGSNTDKPKILTPKSKLTTVPRAKDSPPVLSSHIERDNVPSQRALELLRSKFKSSSPSSLRGLLTVEKVAQLDGMSFRLDQWVEVVDRVAGNRKVSYLFEVEQAGSEASSVERRTVLRSASTVKDALLTMDWSDVTASDSSNQSKAASDSSEWKKLTVESREFLYDTINKETEGVAHVLQQIANHQPRSNLARLQQAVLHSCLTSTGKLPRMRCHQELGVQLSTAKREQMDIIMEKGVYRMHSASFMRQEWLILTTSELQLFRSFTVRPCKTIVFGHILAVKAAEPESVLANTSPTDTDTHSNRWFCVQVHLVTEVVTLFMESDALRAQFLTTLTQLIRLSAKSSQATVSSVPTPCVTIDALNGQFCLNRRNPLTELASTKAARSSLSSTVIVHVAELLKKGLRLYSTTNYPNAPVIEPKQVPELLAFLDGVERLSGVSLHAASGAWPSTHEEKLSFALNLHQLVYVHCTLVFGFPTNHAQWKKFQTLLVYSLGAPNERIHLALVDIEHILLRSRMTNGGSIHPESALKNAVPLPGPTQPQLEQLCIDQPDFRAVLALQSNASPKTTNLLQVYSWDSFVHNELNQACTRFLASDLIVVEDVDRMILLPRICEWYLDDFCVSRTQISAGKPTGDELSGGAASGTASTGNGTNSLIAASRSFVCLQKLLGFLEASQHDTVHRLLFKSGMPAQIKFHRFWTQDPAMRRSSSNVNATLQFIQSLF